MRSTGLLLIGAAIVTSLTMVAPASAQQPLPAELGDQIDAIVEQNYRGSPQAEPPNCGTTCQQLWAGETRPGQTGLSGPSGPSDLERLHRDSRSLRIKTKLMPALRVLGTAHLAYESFNVGWRIGSFANNKFLKIGIPPTENYSMALTGQRIAFRAAGQNLTPYTPSPMPEDGWVWEYTGGAYWYSYWQSPDCEPSPHQRQGPSGGFETVTWPTSDVWCWTAYPERQRRPMFSSYLPENDLAADAPVEDYDGQPYGVWTAPPPDPGQSSVRSAIEEALESGEFPTLRNKYEYELGVPGACDPVDPNVCNPPDEATPDKQKRCDLGSKGEQQDPDPGRTTKLGDPALYEAHINFERRPVGGDEDDRVPTALKKGWTRDVRPNKKEWEGWGWRHIAAKHGWSTADEQATADALREAPDPLSPGDDRLRYVGDEYDNDGAICERVVVVAPNALTQFNEPAPKEITTSYGRFVRYTAP
jgi:hypothetical protein